MFDLNKSELFSEEKKWEAKNLNLLTSLPSMRNISDINAICDFSFIWSTYYATSVTFIGYVHGHIYSVNLNP